MSGLPDRTRRSDTRLNQRECHRVDTGSDEVTLRGDDGDRTHDLRLAKPALYQLSYVPGDLILPSAAIRADGVGRLARADGRREAVDARRRPSAVVSLRSECRALRHGRKS